jgi:tubulin-specific chaperone A
MATLRNLKIKTSTCRRIVKELRSYEREVEKEAAKTAGMKDRGADPYDLKQQVSKSSLFAKAVHLPACLLVSAGNTDLSSSSVRSVTAAY